MYGCGGNSAVQPHSMGGVMGGRQGTHTGTHTGTYTQMLHLHFSDLPLKKCPISAPPEFELLEFMSLRCCSLERRDSLGPLIVPQPYQELM